ncbi:MAG: iron-containing alcohol dehydrogenase [Pseudomonadota bacterium]
MNPTFLPDVTIQPGGLKLLGKKILQLGMKKPLIVSDQGLTRLGLTQRVRDVLAPGFGDPPVFDHCPENPAEDAVAAGAEMFMKSGCDGVAALGGGSPMDVAKGIRIVAAHGGGILDYDVNKVGVKKIGRGLPPMIALPTTAGSGSEATLGAVILDSRSHIKTLIFSPFLGAAAAILDPELTLSLPPALTAATGMDALIHALEAYTAKGGNVVVRGLCRDSLQLIGRGLKKAVRDGGDVEARQDMMTAAFLSGLAFANVGLGAVHAAAHQLGGRAGIAHGLSNSLMLPAVMKFNGPAAEADYVEICRWLGLPAASAGEASAALKAYAQDLGLPTRLRDLGVTADLFEQMAEDAVKDPALRSNPRPATKDDFIAFYRESY